MKYVLETSWNVDIEGDDLQRDNFSLHYLTVGAIESVRNCCPVNSKAISKSLTFLYKFIYLQSLNLRKQTLYINTSWRKIVPVIWTNFLIRVRILVEPTSQKCHHHWWGEPTGKSLPNQGANNPIWPTDKVISAAHTCGTDIVRLCAN